MGLWLPSDLREVIGFQAGAVSRRQLRTAGIGSSAVQRQLVAGRWQRVFPGVVVCHSGPIGRGAELWAAALYAGEGAALSHQTAAEVWQLTGRGGGSVHVSVAADRKVGSRSGLIVHRRRNLAELIHPTRMPSVIGLEETVLDMVEDSTDVLDAIGWVTTACRQRKTTPVRLMAALRGRSRIRWRHELVVLLDEVAQGAESPLEVLYLREVEQRHGLPAGARQRHRRVGKRTQWSDVAYDEFGVLVELDGRIGHENEPFRDHRRDNLSTRRGKATLRYGWEPVFGAPCAVAAEVADVLIQNGWAGRPRACGPGCAIARAA